MKSDLNPQLLTSAIAQFLHRYHVIVFVLIVIGGLAWANFMINQAINEQPAELPPQTTSSFDKATMDKIDKLNKSSSEPTEFTLPSGRTNPFI